MKKKLLSILLIVMSFTINAQTIIYVDSAATGSTHDGTSWTTAYTQLSDACIQFNAAAVTTQFEVRIAKGTYYPASNNRISTFGIYRGGIKLLGAYLAGTNIRDTALYPTILSGNLGVQNNIGDNSYHVLVLAGIAATADSIILDRLNITKGYANGFTSSTYNGVSIPQFRGAGIYSVNAHPVITNCNFSGNTAVDIGYGGGGGAIFNANSNPKITNCNFSGNTASNTFGGAIYNSSSSPTVINCTFSGNMANISGAGGAIYNANSNPIITACDFSGNTTGNNGGAMYNNLSNPTITNCSFSGNMAYDYTGGAIINEYSNPTISACSFSGNICGHGGGGIGSYNSNATITDCTFFNNTSGLGGAVYTYFSDLIIINCSFWGNTATSSGGAISNNGSNPTITGCLFLGNAANVVGGGMDNDFSNPVITNSTFAGNTVTQPTITYGGGMHNNFSNPVITNTTFSGNTSPHNGGGMYNEFSAPKITNSTFFNNTPNAMQGVSDTVSLQNSIVWDTIINTNYTAYNSIIRGLAPYNNLIADQLFKNSANLKGVDNVWNTADDGLQLLPCGPAVNVGNNDSIPVGIITDITGSPRIQYAVVDMGAYESGSMWNSSNANITDHNTHTNAYVTIGSTTYFTMMCDTLLAAVRNSTNPNDIKGNTTATVWIDAITTGAFAARHYQILPDSNANSATAFVTLYFLQSEFDSYNLANVATLPGNPVDAAGIANLRILKIGGASSDGSGLPASYPGTQSTLDPDDSNIIWNSAANRWEVSFAVAGFGGFFVQTSSTPLSILLEQFTGYRMQQENHLSWKLSDEQNMEKYELERSTDAKNFAPIATIANIHQRQYNYIDKDVYYEGNRYYRLKLVQSGGTSSYSNNIALSATGGKGSFTLFPNPAGNNITIFTPNLDLLPNRVVIYDAIGEIVTSIDLTENKQSFDVSGLATGLYFIHIGNGEVLKFVKQ